MTPEDIAKLKPRDRHLFAPGPKRILSLDGGGVRGAVSIGFLERLERLVEDIEGKPTLLGDWFDLIGGTSTGAIIAAALALGYTAREVHELYSTGTAGLPPAVLAGGRSARDVRQAEFGS